MKSLEEILMIPPEELGKGSSIKVEILPTEEDVYHDCARVMFNEIKKNNELGKPTVFILPVGPTGQYPRLARLCNLEGVSCENVVCINMDEYLTDDGTDYIPYSNPLSFRRFMDECFYSLLDDDKKVKPENRIFPNPRDPGAIQRKIEEYGGVDICFGGIGITGHIAFNEPPEPEEEISPEEFKNLSTRVLDLTRETIVINSVTVAKGNMDAIPRKAVTVGMKEILGARKIRIYMNREWQTAIARKFIHGPITPRVPASFLQEHPDVKVVMTQQVARVPAPALGGCQHEA